MDGRNATLVERYYPGYRSPKLVYEQVLGERVGPETTWLDIGCGKRICADEVLNAALPRRARIAVGCDRDPHLSRHSSIKHLVLCDASALPFRAGVFNLVTASMVVEHLENPQQVFDEVHRVSRPGGGFVVFTPNRFNYAMLVAAATPYRFHVFWKKLTYYLARREWRDFGDDLFPTWYRANSVGALRRLLVRSSLREERLQYLSLAHSFGFVRPLYALSLLFERLIDSLRLDVLKADILGIFVRDEPSAEFGGAAADPMRRVAAGGR
jgi:SAM-dependent methyltransferase